MPPRCWATYAVADGTIRFTPLFPFDEGRQYQVRFDPARLPGAPADAGVVETTVGRPASTAVPSTVVARVYPSGDVVPENLLRMYVEFSAPMGRKSGVEYITLLDHAGKEIPGAVLPLEYEFWSPDHKRFTVFFDPGRVKKGILPNRQMGRPLEVGRSVTFVISHEWPDEHGLPLKEDFRRTLRVGPTDLEPLDTAHWRIQPPQAGGRSGLIVTFPEPLDHGLLMRALGVTRDGKEVDGEIAVDQLETRWTFTPSEPWRAGSYALLALDILEDVAGNQIGRAFEVDNFESVDKGPNPADDHDSVHREVGQPWPIAPTPKPTVNRFPSSNVLTFVGLGGRPMSFLKRLLGRDEPPKPRVRVCVECGMPVAEHKDWCSILRGQIEMKRRSEEASELS